MKNLFQGKWWMLLLRGIIAIILGILLLFNLEESVMGVLIFIGYYLIIEGLIKISQAYMERKVGENMWPTLLAGLAAIILGIVVFFWPQLTAIILIALVATHAVFQGATDLYTVYTTRSEMKTGWLIWYLFAGIAQIIFGVWMVLQPVLGGLTIVAVIGIYGIVIGVVLIVLAFQTRSGRGGSGKVAIAN